MSSMTTPPAHSDAAERCTQSASSDHFEAGGSTAECPDSERPAARPSESASAGTRNVRRRSVSQPRKTSAVTMAKPSVITTKASPKRVSPAKGDRSP